jgi:phospholipase C
MIGLKLPLMFCVVCLLVIMVGCGGTAGSSAPPTPTLTVTKSHIGNFPPGQSGAGPTTGAVTVTDTLPSGLTATKIAGTGWTCTLGSLSCSRSDALGPNSNYSDITVTVNIGNSEGTVTNQVAVSGGGAPDAAATDPTTIGPGQITHVVIIFQENRTPDNLFQGLCTANGGVPGCDPTGANPLQYDIASSGKTSSGKTIPLTPVAGGLVTDYDMVHEHNSFLDACDYQPSTNTCAMDGADTNTCAPRKNCPPYPEYQYVPASAVGPYLTMAETYTFGDHMFQTNQGPSFPAHQYIISGTSRISPTSTISVADNPYSDVRPDGEPWAGCLAPPGAGEMAIDISNPDPRTPETALDYPLCYDHRTLTDLLDEAQLSWKYYAPVAGDIWTAPNALEHMCKPTGPANDTACSAAEWTNADPKVVIEGTDAQILTDISNGQLAAVSWVIPDGSASDHAGNATDTGPSWVANIVNAIGQSQQYWGNTAIIVTWDDWGGWYDHVPPPQIRDSYEYGLRVPLMVISAYAKPAYISHVNHDFGSILKFVEETFSLPEIDPAVGYGDSYALDDLSDCFNFNQLPLIFTPIPTEQGPEYFLNNKSPATPPDND